MRLRPVQASAATVLALFCGAGLFPAHARWFVDVAVWALAILRPQMAPSVWALVQWAIVIALFAVALGLFSAVALIVRGALLDRGARGRR